MLIDVTVVYTVHKLTSQRLGGVGPGLAHGLCPNISRWMLENFYQPTIQRTLVQVLHVVFSMVLGVGVAMSLERLRVILLSR